MAATENIYEVRARHLQASLVRRALATIRKYRRSGHSDAQMEAAIKELEAARRDMESA